LRQVALKAASLSTGIVGAAFISDLIFSLKAGGAIDLKLVILVFEQLLDAGGEFFS
jgi:hypothetical protein